MRTKTYNQKGCWKLVSKRTGDLLETFRCKNTALEQKRKLEVKYMEEILIIPDETKQGLMSKQLNGSKPKKVTTK